MAKNFLVLGPAGAGKTSLVRALLAEHPDHCWHLVQLEPCATGSPVQLLRVHATEWAGLWHLRYQQDSVPTALGDLVSRIDSESPVGRTIVAFESVPDPILRHALQYDLRVFVMPPIQDETEVFRSRHDSRHALQEILRDTSAFSAEIIGMTEPEADQSDAAEHPLGPLPAPPEGSDLNESQVERFLACPLGMELGARVHLRPAFAALADADLVVLNTAVGDPFQESDTCWHKIQVLLGRLHKSSGRAALTYACDLTDPQDPCRVRALRRLSESLCRV